MNVRISTLLAVLALSLTAALLVGAGPAFADDPVPTRGAVDDAAFDAAALLASRPECFRTLSPGGNPRPPDNLNPSTVLGRVPPIAISATPLAQEPRAIAGVAASDSGRGAAGPARGQITVYPPFATFDYNPLVVDTFAFRLTRAVTIEDMQTLAILHELAHLTGALPAEATLGPPPAGLGGGNVQVGQVFNTKILVYCLGAAEFRTRSRRCGSAGSAATRSIASAGGGSVAWPTGSAGPTLSSCRGRATTTSMVRPDP